MSKYTPTGFNPQFYQRTLYNNPVRPQTSSRLFGTRGFSSTAKEDKQSVLYSEEYLARQEKEKTSKGKFFEFIQTIDRLDKQPPKTENAAEQKEGAAKDYDISELDISFEKISSSAGRGGQGA